MDSVPVPKCREKGEVAPPSDTDVGSAGVREPSIPSGNGAESPAAGLPETRELPDFLASQVPFPGSLRKQDSDSFRGGKHIWGGDGERCWGGEEGTWGGGGEGESGGSIASDYGELWVEHGPRIEWIVRRTGIRAWEDACSAIVLRMIELDFLGTYDPSLSGPKGAVASFVRRHVLRHVQEQVRFDARHLLVGDVAAFVEGVESLAAADIIGRKEEGYSEVELGLTLEVSLDAKGAGTRSRVVWACGKSLDRFGKVTGATLAEVLSISPEMARRYLAELREERVSRLLRDGDLG